MKEHSLIKKGSDRRYLRISPDLTGPVYETARCDTSEGAGTVCFMGWGI